MTERSGYQENADGTLTACGLVKRERHIQAIEEQNRIIRRRNERIAELEAELATARSYGEMLEQMGIRDFIEGAEAVNLGARLLAMGVSFDDIQRWRNQEISEEMRVLRRINERKKVEETA